MTTFGLPRHVLTFLRHMEPYKEFLKWDLCEGSHKITLRLSWNFRKHAGRESLWQKLQRTMKLTGHQTTSPDSAIPQDLSRFLEASPKKSHPSGRSSASSAFSRPLNWARISSSISLPSRWRHSNSSSAHHQHHSPARNNSLRSATSAHSPPPASPSRLSLPVSPSRYSWPGTALGNCSPTGPMSEPTAPHSTITSTPDSVRSDDSPYHHCPDKIRLSYRMEEDIARSLEDIADRLHEQNKAELHLIQREWSDAIRNWQRVLQDEEDGAGDTTLTNTSQGTESGSGGGSQVNLQQVNQTVIRCLETCDSILDKHSTLIL